MELKVVNGGKHRIAFNDRDKIELSSLEVSQAGEKIKLALLTIGPEEGMTTGQAATLFNVTESAILKHLDKYAITYGTLFRNMLQVLKDNEVISKHASRAIFIPRRGLRDLMWLIGTEEARAAYRQIFDDAEAYIAAKALIAAQEDQISELREQVHIADGQKEALIQLLMKCARRSKETWNSVDFIELPRDGMGMPRFEVVVEKVRHREPNPSNAYYKIVHGLRSNNGTAKSCRKRLLGLNLNDCETAALADSLVDISEGLRSRVESSYKPIFNSNNGFLN
ncbi:MAG: hypothetical protein M3Q07_24390 [Pseudobdellovibrionaceae bacterium]|nr:hypothetical protein [Pseudobdellovibrionaceae bacterium]